MTKRYVLVFLMVGVLMSLQAGARQVHPLVDSANQQYQNGHYHQAIELYSQVLAAGKEAPGIYYNLANAYYKSNQLAPAILNYERARLRDPGNEDIRHNLKLARQQITDRIEKIPEFFLTRWFRQFINLFSSDQWAYISMATFLAFLLLFSLYLYAGRLALKKGAFWSSILTLAIAVSSFAFSLQQKQDIVRSQEAIVFDAKVTVRSSPDESGTELFVIHEGTKVYIEDRVSEWYEIELTDGSQGWLKRQSVEPI